VVDDSGSKGFPIALVPLRMTRIGSLIGSIAAVAGGVVLIIFGVAYPGSGHLSWLVWMLGGLGVLVAVYGAILCVRMPRVAAIVSKNDMLVRGIFADTRIDRGRITGIEPSGTISWIDESGRNRRTFVSALDIDQPGLAAPGPVAHSARAVALLRSWTSDENWFPSD
jgi:hypothetical protein